MTCPFFEIPSSCTEFNLKPKIYPTITTAWKWQQPSPFHGYLTAFKAFTILNTLFQILHIFIFCSSHHDIFIYRNKYKRLIFSKFYSTQKGDYRGPDGPDAPDGPGLNGSGLDGPASSFPSSDSISLSGSATFGRGLIRDEFDYYNYYS